MSYANRANQTGGNRRQEARQRAQTQRASSQGGNQRNRSQGQGQNQRGRNPGTDRRNNRTSAGETPLAGGNGATSTTANTGSAAQGASQSSYSYATVPGQLINQALGGLTDWMNRYGKDNETVAGLGHGTFADIFKTQANTGLAIQYNDAFLGSLGNYQKGLEDLKTGNTSRLMAQEGAISERLLDMQTGRQLESNKYVADQSLAGTRYASDRDLESNKYVADQSLAGNKYVADRSLESNKYTADRSLEGVRYGYDSQERQIGLQGAQDRLTKTHETDQALRMRTDARGAIRSQGARFFG